MGARLRRIAVRAYRRALAGPSVIALVLGGAACLHADLEAARALVDPAECMIVATNDAGVVWPDRLDHWVTMHALELPYRIAQREANGYPAGFTTWTRPYPFGLKDREAICDRLITGFNGGSSGLLAVGVALTEAGSAVLCGMPMDDSPHFNRGPGPWDAVYGYREGWTERYALLKDRVRSFSGWTRAQYGAPTANWLDAMRSDFLRSSQNLQRS